MKKILLASLLSSLAMAGSIAHAQTTTANFQATSTLSSSCTISAPNINFGTVNLISGPNLNQAFTVTVLCNKGVAYTILPDGTSQNPIAFPRKMAGTNGNTDTLSYFFINVDQQKSWYNDPAFALTGTGTGANQVYNLSVTIDKNASKTAKPDVYTGTTVATITY